jgi:hypothetical protein
MSARDILNAIESSGSSKTPKKTKSKASQQAQFGQSMAQLSAKKKDS